jgi:hypothetical protein
LIPLALDLDQHNVEYLDSDGVSECVPVESKDADMLDFNYGFVRVKHPRHGFGYLLSVDLEY